MEASRRRVKVASPASQGGASVSCKAMSPLTSFGTKPVKAKVDMSRVAAVSMPGRTYSPESSGAKKPKARAIEEFNTTPKAADASRRMSTSPARYPATIQHLPASVSTRSPRTPVTTHSDSPYGNPPSSQRSNLSSVSSGTSSGRPALQRAYTAQSMQGTPLSNGPIAAYATPLNHTPLSGSSAVMCSTPQMNGANATVQSLTPQTSGGSSVAMGPASRTNGLLNEPSKPEARTSFSSESSLESSVLLTPVTSPTLGIDTRMSGLLSPHDDYGSSQKQTSEEMQRFERRILDLEIRNESLLEINGALERQRIKYKKELRELKGRRQSEFKSDYQADVVDSEGSDSESSDDETSIDTLIQSDKQFRSIINNLDYLIRRAQHAVDDWPQVTAGRVLSSFEIEEQEASSSSEGEEETTVISID